MKKKTFVLKFTDSEREFMFEDKLFVIEDKKLIENLEKPSIKNSESKLVIKPLNDTHVSDVIQLKINMSETGYFLVNFAKDSISEEKRKVLLEEIGKLKSNAVQTNSTQLKKARLLVRILNKYKPLYATFINDGEYKVNPGKLSLEEYTFPLLVLKKPEKRFMVRPKVKAPKEKPVKETKPEKVKAEKEEKQAKPQKLAKKKKPKQTYSAFPLFSADYLFVFLFATLCAFGVITAFFEFKNDENIWIFLAILSFAFAIVLVLSVQSTCYKKGRLINPFLRYYLIIFIVIGVAGGIVGGYYVSKLVLKTEIEDFDYKNLLIISSAIAAPVCLSALSTSRLVNLISKKRNEKKN